MLECTIGRMSQQKCVHTAMTELYDENAADTAYVIPIEDTVTFNLYYYRIK